MPEIQRDIGHRRGQAYEQLLLTGQGELQGRYAADHLDGCPLDRLIIDQGRDAFPAAGLPCNGFEQSDPL